MPYPSNKHRYAWCILLAIISLPAFAQVRWTGSAGDGQWATPGNWDGNILPSATDNVVLDNNLAAGNYTVSLPGPAGNIIVRSLLIRPADGNTIKLLLPASSTAIPAFTASGPGYGIVIGKGGILQNSSGATAGSAIAVSDSFQIANGGQYTHNSRSAHTSLVTLLSRQPGTEKGLFVLDAPGHGYTFASTGRFYGTLVFSAVASGGSQSYTTTAASPFTVRGDMIIQAGVTVTLNITAAVVMRGDYIQQGGIFNLASQATNNIVFIGGHLSQLGGTITASETAHPFIELNGSSNQHLTVAGGIENHVGLRINNTAGVTMLSALSLPYRLELQKGILHAQPFLLTLRSGCSLQADSAAATCFVNGAIKKEGLYASSHFLFPLGKGGTQRWMALKNASGNYTVEFFKSNPAGLSSLKDPNIHHVSTLEYWSVQADTAPLPSAAVELSFDHVNSGGVTELGSLRVARLADGRWTDKTGTAVTGSAGAAGSVTSSMVEAFNASVDYFTLASSAAGQNPLPLKLLAFSSHTRGSIVINTWQVDPAWKPGEFELQWSADGEHFNAIARIPAAENKLIYQYTDKRLLLGRQYYRLRATEKGGSFVYSSSATVSLQPDKMISVQVIPSVVKSNARLLVNAVSAFPARLYVLDEGGRMQSDRILQLHAGMNDIPLSLQGLAAGWHVITIVTPDGNTHTSTFIKTR